MELEWPKALCGILTCVYMSGLHTHLERPTWNIGFLLNVCHFGNSTLYCSSFTGCGKSVEIIQHMFDVRGAQVFLLKHLTL